MYACSAIDFAFFGLKPFTIFAHKHSRRSHFGNLHEMIHSHGPEKAKAWGKIIDIQARRDTGPQVLRTVESALCRSVLFRKEPYVERPPGTMALR